MITGTLNATATTDDLDIDAGTGTIEITGDIAGTTAFATIDLNAVASGSSDGTTVGGVTLGGNIGVGTTSGTTPGVALLNLGNNNTTGAITLSGTVYNTSDDIVIKGGSYAINATSGDVTILTSGDPVTFAFDPLK